MSRSHGLLREGLIAGVIGATSVALWFLLVDTVDGRPFHTPTVLGGALFSILGPRGGETDTMLVAGYTVFHYLAFFGVGVLATWIVHQARSEPTILAGVLVLFAIVTMAFYGLAAALAQAEVFGALAWYQILIGNLIASATMGTYLWRTHPGLGTGFAEALGGRG
jgi:hypothetical protein